MQGNLDNPPIVVRTSRSTALWMLLAAIVFVCIGTWMVRNPRAARPSDVTFGYVGIAFFGLGIPVFAIRLLRPDALEISPTGLTWRTLRHTSTFPWRAVREFRPYRPSSRTLSSQLGVIYADDYGPEQRASRGLARSLTGVDGSFGGGWELSAADLADLLNAARARWTATRAGR